MLLYIQKVWWSKVFRSFNSGVNRKNKSFDKLFVYILLGSVGWQQYNIVFDNQVDLEYFCCKELIQCWCLTYVSMCYYVMPNDNHVRHLFLAPESKVYAITKWLVSIEDKCLWSPFKWHIMFSYSALIWAQFCVWCEHYSLMLHCWCLSTMMYWRDGSV